MGEGERMFTAKGRRADKGKENGDGGRGGRRGIEEQRRIEVRASVFLSILL